MSTAYHPKTNEQTERTNQTLKTYLRCYVNDKQSNWVEMLPMAQLVYNNHQSKITEQTPFFANYKRHPNLFKESREGLNAKKAEIRIDKLKTTHKKIRERIKKNQLQTNRWNNKQRQNESQLKKKG